MFSSCVLYVEVVSNMQCNGFVPADTHIYKLDNWVQLYNRVYGIKGKQNKEKITNWSIIMKNNWKQITGFKYDCFLISVYICSVTLWVEYCVPRLLRLAWHQYL